MSGAWFPSRVRRGPAEDSLNSDVEMYVSRETASLVGIFKVSVSWILQRI